MLIKINKKRGFGKKSFTDRVFQNEKINELIVFFLAFKLGPSITGFSVISHTDSSDFDLGTHNRINKFKYLTNQIKKYGGII